MAAGIGGVGLGASLGGGLLSAFGAHQAGERQQQMYNYQAQVARINADIDKQNAAYARNKGEIEATQYGQKAAQQRGGILSAQAASGLDVNSGSAAQVRSSQGTLTRMDLTQIRSNAAKVAYDYDVKSTMDINQANLDVMAGENAAKAGNINAMSSILGTVGSVSSKWMQGSQMGMWGST